MPVQRAVEVGICGREGKASALESRDATKKVVCGHANGLAPGRAAPPNSDWIESRMVRTLYTADHFSCRRHRGESENIVSCRLAGANAPAPVAGECHRTLRMSKQMLPY